MKSNTNNHKLKDFTLIQVKELGSSYLELAKVVGKDASDQLFKGISDNVDPDKFSKIISTALSDGKVSVDELKQAFEEQGVEIQLTEEDWEKLIINREEINN